MEKWELSMKDDVFGYYLTTIAAVDDVYCQATGCNEWDTLNTDKIAVSIPTDIYEWDRRPNDYRIKIN